MYTMTVGMYTIDILRNKQTHYCQCNMSDYCMNLIKIVRRIMWENGPVAPSQG